MLERFAVDLAVGAVGQLVGAGGDFLTKNFENNEAISTLGKGMQLVRDVAEVVTGDKFIKAGMEAVSSLAKSLFTTQEETVSQKSSAKDQESNFETPQVSDRSQFKPSMS